jgi:hypothetical protein
MVARLQCWAAREQRVRGAVPHPPPGAPRRQGHGQEAGHQDHGREHAGQRRGRPHGQGRGEVCGRGAPSPSSIYIEGRVSETLPLALLLARRSACPSAAWREPATKCVASRAGGRTACVVASPHAAYSRPSGRQGCQQAPHPERRQGGAPRATRQRAAQPRRRAGCGCTRAEPRWPYTLLLIYTCSVRTRA